MGRFGALLAGAMAICALALPATAGAQAAGDIKVRLGAHHYPRPWGLTYVYGYIRVAKGADETIRRGKQVTLEQSVWPFTSWQPIGSTTTEFNGYFSFRRWNIINNQKFRATAQLDSGAYVSQVLVLHVPFRARMTVSVRKAKKAALVTVSGKVRPARPGKTVAIQRRSPTSGWRTVTRTKLRGATAGSSSFKSRPMRIRHDSIFRVRVRSDALNSVGMSGGRLVHVR
ncbi:MAG TPA: hypothetical protein VF752_09760 [Thermoleophilaceae bacterium]